MGAGFSDVAMVEINDLVGVGQRSEVVGNDDGGAACDKSP
jgi:hypothetical protein